VNCHGTAVASPTVDHELDAWDRTLEVNLTSVFTLCRLAGTHMLERGSGKIINIASMYFFFGGVNVPAYSASKGGVAQLTKALSNEWAGRGLNVNAIAPGYIRTELNRHIWEDEVRSSEILGRIPSGRWGEPEDMAEPAVFLASDAAQYIHGIVLPVDGGFMAR
jgi:2-deoxy-D-gluconate 3-dehydrogenase